MVTIDEYSLAAVAASIIIGTPVTFYITKFLEDRSKFKRFKAKLDSVAGVGSKLLWQGGSTVGAGSHFTTDVFTVLEITDEGLVLQNDLHKIFVPIDKVLSTEIIRPSENYEQLRKERMRAEFTMVVDTMMDPMIKKLKEVLVKELLTPNTELNAVVGVQILGQLKDAGVDTSKVELEQPTLARLLAEIKNPKVQSTSAEGVEVVTQRSSDTASG